MFDLGFWELLFIGVIALIVLGPERLPVAARTLGRWVGRARAYTRNLSDELNREVEVRELRENMRAAESGFRSEVAGVKREMREMATGTTHEQARPNAAAAPDAELPPAADASSPVADDPVTSDNASDPASEAGSDETSAQPDDGNRR